MANFLLLFRCHHLNTSHCFVHPHCHPTDCHSVANLLLFFHCRHVNIFPCLVHSHCHPTDCQSAANIHLLLLRCRSVNTSLPSACSLGQHWGGALVLACSRRLYLQFLQGPDVGQKLDRYQQHATVWLIIICHRNRAYMYSVNVIFILLWDVVLKNLFPYLSVKIISQKPMT